MTRMQVLLSRSRRLWLLVALGSTVAVAGAVVATGSSTDPARPTRVTALAPACPDTYVARGRTPPVPPVQEGSGPADRLVPAPVPAAAVICRYSPLKAAGGSRLQGQRVLHGGLESVPDDLNVPAPVSGQRSACTLVGSAQIPIRLGLSYGRTVTWVATVENVNGCQDVTNGRFSSHTYVADELETAYQRVRWDLRHVRPSAACPAALLDRAGQDRVLVPTGATRLVVCAADGKVLTRLTDARHIAAATALLDQPRPEPSTNGCSGQVTHSRSLVFGYPYGRSILIHVLQGCRPSVFSSSLQAQLDPVAIAALFAITG